MIAWTCDECSQPIEDGHGEIELPLAERIRLTEQRSKSTGRARWRALHNDCDPDRGEPSYWFTVDRVRTHEGLLARTLLLMGKSWLPDTDWRMFVHEHAAPRHDTSGA